MKIVEYMPNRYKEPYDIMSRLDRTVIRYRGRLVYARYDMATFRLFDIQGKNILYDEVSPQDPDLDISSVECGYGNFPDKSGKNVVRFIERAPCKQWKQGLSENGLAVYSISGEACSVWSPNGQQLIINSPEFERSVNGIFPTIQEGFDSGKSQFATSIDLAIERTDIGLVMIYYRTELVGYMAESSEVLTPDRPKAWAIIRELNNQGLRVRINKGEFNAYKG